ncbi:hypothetical protein M758_UG331100 [Ceratodon purpureus]|nr:hypothetical protein M758_UG331100 [Ceratodon purpureus]
MYHWETYFIIVMFLYQGWSINSWEGPHDSCFWYLCKSMSYREDKVEFEPLCGCSTRDNCVLQRAQCLY